MFGKVIITLSCATVGFAAMLPKAKKAAPAGIRARFNKFLKNKHRDLSTLYHGTTNQERATLAGALGAVGGTPLVVGGVLGGPGGAAAAARAVATSGLAGVGLTAPVLGGIGLATAAGAGLAMFARNRFAPKLAQEEWRAREYLAAWRKEELPFASMTSEWQNEALDRELETELAFQAFLKAKHPLDRGLMEVTDARIKLDQQLKAAVKKMGNVEEKDIRDKAVEFIEHRRELADE